MENSTGFTCNTCGKVFETEEEFINRHNKNKKQNTNNQSGDTLNN
jgi:uncharacterized C2H2 Zn-finger protein